MEDIIMQHPSKHVSKLIFFLKKIKGKQFHRLKCQSSVERNMILEWNFSAIPWNDRNWFWHQNLNPPAAFKNILSWRSVLNLVTSTWLGRERMSYMLLKMHFLYRGREIGHLLNEVLCELTEEEPRRCSVCHSPRWCQLLSEAGAQWSVRCRHPACCSQTHPAMGPQGLQ